MSLRSHNADTLAPAISWFQLLCVPSLTKENTLIKNQSLSKTNKSFIRNARWLSAPSFEQSRLTWFVCLYPQNQKVQTKLFKAPKSQVWIWKKMRQSSTEDISITTFLFLRSRDKHHFSKSPNLNRYHTLERLALYFTHFPNALLQWLVWNVI